MSDATSSYYPVNPGRDVLMTWRPADWLVVEVGYSCHVVGFWAREGHTEAEAHAVIVATAQLAPERLQSIRTEPLE